VDLLRNKFSVPLANVQLMTVAPYRNILTDAPDECLIVTESLVLSIAILYVEQIEEAWGGW